MKNTDQAQYQEILKRAAATVAGQVAIERTQWLQARFPDLGGRELAKMAQELAEKAIQEDKERFEETVWDVARVIRGTSYPPQSRAYLLEADSFYFYYLTQTVLETGRLGTEIKGMRFFTPLRGGPQGAWMQLLLHPYVGAVWYRLAHAIVPALPLMGALCLLPVGLTLLILAAFLSVAWGIGLGLLAGLVGSLALALAPVVLLRTSFGWYDTDPYNLLFPMGALALFFSFLASGRRTVAFACAAALLTAFYAYFWRGWPFLWILMTVAAVSVGFAKLVRKDADARALFTYALWYCASTLLAAAVMITPVEVVRCFAEAGILARKAGVEATGAAFWPSAFLTVGETKELALKKMVDLTGGLGMWVAALMGVFWEGARAWKDRATQALAHWLTFVVFLVPLYFLSRRAERFSLLFLLPLSFLVAFGVQRGWQALAAQMDRLWAQGPRVLARIPRLARDAAVVGVFLAWFLQIPFLSARVTARGIEPIMNDAWFDALSELRAKAPEDAIVHSWWPPGYFILSVARRAVATDGGSLQSPLTYWVGRALLAQEEREAAGILRMLAAGGNEGLEYLQSLAFELPEAVDLVSAVVPLAREPARALLPPRMGEEEQRRFLDLVQGTGVRRPTYVLVATDTVETAVAIGLVARWNFRKAQAGAFSGRPLSSWDQVVEAGTQAGTVLKYTPEAPLMRQEGERLMFANGLVLDMTSSDALIAFENSDTLGKPMSLFYLLSGELVEKPYVLAPDATIGFVDASALLLKRGGRASSVLAHRELIRSVLFRMYYLGGNGLAIFKPVVAREDKPSRTSVYVYELDWQAFDRETARPSGERPGPALA